MNHDDPYCLGSETQSDDNRGALSYYIECLTQVNYISRGGDSGSPVFVIEDDISTTEREVILVGVHWGPPSTTDNKAFIPIDRIYAESILENFDWASDELKPLPTMGKTNAMFIKTLGDTGFIAQFDEKEISQGYGLRYDAGLYLVGTNGSIQPARDTNGSHIVNQMAYRSPRAEFIFADIPRTQQDNQLGSQFRVRTRLCVETNIDDLIENYRCGDFGPDGDASFTVPPAPQNLRVTNRYPGSRSIRLRWDDIAGNSGYEFDYKRTDIHTVWQSVDNAVHSNTALITNMACNRDYKFILRAYGNGTTYNRTWGFWSSPYSVRLSGCSETDPTGNLTALRNAGEPSNYTVRWDAVTSIDHVTSYMVEIPSLDYLATVSLDSTEHRLPLSAVDGHTGELTANIWYCFDSGLCGLHQEVQVDIDKTSR